MGRLRTNILVVFLGIIFAVWSLNMLGAFRLLDVLVYDLFVQSIPESSEDMPVLLIEAPEKANLEGSDYWIKFLDELDELGAEQVVFLFMPSKAGRGFYKRAVADGNVVFGRPWSPERIRSESQIAPIPKSVGELPIIYGLVTLPPSFYGVHRSYSAYQKVMDNDVPTIVTVAIKDRYGSRAGVDEDFLVFFNGMASGLPNVAIGDVMKGKLVKQLVSGKSVVVGLSQDDLVPGLETPISLANEGLSNLDYIGYALNTLLQGKKFLVFDGISKLVTICATTLVGLVLFHYTSLTVVFLASISLFLVYILATWLVFYYFGFYPPIVEVALAQILSFSFIVRSKVRQREAQVQLTVLETLHLIREKVHPTSFMASKEHWAQVLNLVNQTLYMKRVIFLEPIENKHLVKEIISLNCSIDDIAELRRDYQRSPYTWALEANGPIEVKEFLSETSEKEIQFLVPLIFAGHLEGFWAFSIAPGEKDQVEQFLKTVRDFAEEIATMLYRRRQWLLQQEITRSPIRKLIKLEGGQGTFVEIKKAISFFSRRIEILEDALNSIDTAVLVYDLFGNVLMINKSMTDFLVEYDLPAFEMTALDLAVTLTGMQESEIRPKLRYLTIYSEEISFPLTSKKDNGKSLILSIRPLVREESSTSDTTSPFRVQGILFEIVDLSDIKEAYKFKEEFFKYTNFHLKNDLNQILSTMNQMEDENMEEEEREKLCHSVKGLVSGLNDFTGLLPKYADFEVMAKTGVLPVNPRSCLNAAIRDATLEAPNLEQRCEILECEAYTLVNANPMQLVELLVSILILLDKDAEDDSIHIEIVEKEATVTISMSDTGFGLPNEKFQRFLFEEAPLHSNDYQLLRKNMINLTQWSGSLEASSEVGVGLDFQLHLVKFDKQSAFGS